MSKTPIIIDTDPGVDDACAILYAAYSESIELVGLTTVFGNVAVEQTTRNAGFINTLLPAPVPIAKGAERPIKKGLLGYAEFVHGEKGLGAKDYPPPEDFRPSDESAAEFIVREVKSRPGEITLAPIGPLTNIAHALELDPTIVNDVKAVVLMGGCVDEPGNVSPVAEANIWNDPHAAERVFKAGWEVVMVGLDVTHQLVMSTDDTAMIAQQSPVNGAFLHEITAFYQQYYQGNGFAGFAIHDPTVISYIKHPEWFTAELGQVDVLVDGLGVGQTLFAKSTKNYPSEYWAQRTNVCVPKQVNCQAVIADLIDTLNNMP